MLGNLMEMGIGIGIGLSNDNVDANEADVKLSESYESLGGTMIMLLQIIVKCCEM